MDPVSSADLSAGGKAQVGLIKADLMTKSKSFDDVQKLSEKSKNSNKDRRRHSGSDRKGKNENENNSENENEGIDYILSVENPMINRNLINNEIVLSDNDIKDSFDNIDMQLTKRLSCADLEPYKKQHTITPENKNNLNILKSLGTLRPFKNFQKYTIFPQKSSSETDLSLKLKKDDNLSSQPLDKNVNGVKNNEENDDSGSLNDRRRGRGRERDGENDGERDDDDVDEDDEDEEQFSDNLDDLSLERISEDRGGRSHESSEDLTAFDNYNDNDNDNYGSEIFSNNNDTLDNENNTEIDPESVNSESVNKELLDSPMSSQKNYRNSNIETNLLLTIDENSQLTEEKVKLNSQKFGQNNQNEKIRENESGITDFGVCEIQDGVNNEQNIVNDNEYSLNKSDDNTRIELDAIFQKDGNEKIRKLSNDGFLDKNVEKLNDTDAYVIGEVSDVSNNITVATVSAVESAILTDMQSKKVRKMSTDTDKKNIHGVDRESNKTNASNLKSTNDVKVLRTYTLDGRTVPSAPLALTKSRSTSSLRFQGEGSGTLTGIYPQGTQNAALNATSECQYSMMQSNRYDII
jgi:hypothetical protein